MDTMGIISFLMNDYGFERDDIICINGVAGDHMSLVTRRNILKGMAWLVELMIASSFIAQVWGIFSGSYGAGE